MKKGGRGGGKEIIDFITKTLLPLHLLMGTARLPWK